MDIENSSALLSRLNQKDAYRHIPIAVYLGLVGISGLIGNSVVCYIYIAVYTQSNSRTFIICLAVIDLCTSVVDIPLEIANVLNQYEFREPLLCKFSRSGNALTTLYSSAILLTIAIDKYLKICRPFGNQITKKTAKILCFVLFLITLIVVSPTLLMYGVKSTAFKYEGVNLTRQECSIDDDYKNSKYPIIYSGTMLVLFVGALSLLVVLYTLIGRKVRFFAYKNEQREMKSNTMDSDDNIDDDVNVKNLRRVAMNNTVRQNQYVEITVAVSTNNRTDQDVKDTNSSVQKSKSKENINSRGAELNKTTNLNNQSSTQLDQLRRRRNLARNTTYLMFIVTTSFIIACLPYLVLVLIANLNKNWVENMVPKDVVLYRFFLRSYFLSAAVNPIIYSIFDRRFKHACRGVARKLKSKLCKCYSHDVTQQ